MIAPSWALPTINAAAGGREKCAKMAELIRERTAVHANDKPTSYEPPTKPHEIELAFVQTIGFVYQDRNHGAWRKTFMGIRYCTRCMDAMPAIGFTTDPTRPVMKAKDINYKLDMERECWK